MGRKKVTIPENIAAKIVKMYASGINLQLCADYAEVSIPTMRRELGTRLNKSKGDFLTRVAECAGVRALAGSDRLLELILTTQARWSKTESVDITSGGEKLEILVTRRTKDET